MADSSQTIYAVIDIGSLSILLLVARVEVDGSINALEQKFSIAGLGHGVSVTGMLSAKGQKKALEILEGFRLILEKYNDIEITVLATEAMRRAKNSPDFIESVNKEFDWNIEIINTEREAELSYFGAVSGTFDYIEKYCIIDVGGGSTEFALGTSKKIYQQASLPIGCVNLMDAYPCETGLCGTDRIAVMNYIKLKLQELDFELDLADDTIIVGSGGTISTLAAIGRKADRYEPGMFDDISFSKAEVWKMYYQLNEMDYDARGKLPGLEDGREEVIIYGALIFATLMEVYGVEVIRVSDRGLRYGYLVDQARKTFDRNLV